MTISKKQVGTVLIEVSNSNPNGNIEDNTPREFGNGRGWITPQSLKRRLYRDILENHDVPEFLEIVDELGIDPERFHIAETRHRGFSDINDPVEAKNKMVKMFSEDPDAAIQRYADIRIFGSTLLDGGDPDNKKAKGEKLRQVRSGCVQFAPAVSVAEIVTEIAGITKHAPLEDDKCRDGNSNFGQGAIRIVRHGLYVFNYYVSPKEAYKSNADDQDIDVLKFCIPLGFEMSKSAQRSGVKIVGAFHATHDSALGSFPDHLFTQAATPVLSDGVEDPESLSDYDIPSLEDIQKALKGYAVNVEDLLASRYQTA